MDQFVIGIDYGTDSVRAVVVNTVTGREEAAEMASYHRWAEGKYCAPSKNQFRQHPLDYIEGLEASVKGALAKLPSGTGKKVIGIGIDTTGSTPCPVDRQGTPLALKDEFKDNPNAMFVLWKDHTAVREAEEINKAARGWGGVDFTKYVGGVYSSEWFWAKILHILREDPQVKEAAFSWVEHCDWIPAHLTGTTDPLTMKRSRCAAGHKAIWHREWGGLPPEEFLVHIDPLLKGIRGRLYSETYTSQQKAGDLTPEWADRLGLSPGIPVAVGAFDAHMGAVGGQIEQATLAKIMGTSTCDMMIASYETIGDRLIKGICGQVDGSIIPGMIGLEAGQSALGDVYAWFRDLLTWPLANLLPSSSQLPPDTAEKLREELYDRLLDELTVKAAALGREETKLLALDWLNGRRTPFADQTLTGALVGLTLGSTAPHIFRTLVEATAFGAKAIVDQFVNEGIEIKQVIALGGIPQKSPFVMQVTADILDMPIRVARSEQTCALGAAMFGAVAAGCYPTIQEAQEKMGSGFSRTFTPNPDAAAWYRRQYEKYLLLGKTLAEQLRGI